MSKSEEMQSRPKIDLTLNKTAGDRKEHDRYVGKTSQVICASR